MNKLTIFCSVKASMTQKMYCAEQRFCGQHPRNLVTISILLRASFLSRVDYNPATYYGNHGCEVLLLLCMCYPQTELEIWGSDICTDKTDVLQDMMLCLLWFTWSRKGNNFDTGKRFWYCQSSTWNRIITAEKI